MQVKNNYKLEWKITNAKGFSIEEGLGVFNGDMGIIKQINTYSERITVVFDENREAEYPFSSLDELELAYAITIHKSQEASIPLWFFHFLAVRRFCVTGICSILQLQERRNVLRLQAGSLW